MWQKRAIYTAKETYIYGKRDLRIWQKRSTNVSKEIYSCGKRQRFYTAKETCSLPQETLYYGQIIYRYKICVIYTEVESNFLAKETCSLPQETQFYDCQFDGQMIYKVQNLCHQYRS